MTMLAKEEVEAILDACLNTKERQQPFPPGTMLDCDLKLFDRLFGEPHGNDYEYNLTFEGLIIKGSVDGDHNRIAEMSFRDTRIEGDLSLRFGETETLDLQGTIVVGVLNLSCTKISEIRCNSKDAAAIHFAVPNAGLVMKGVL